MSLSIQVINDLVINKIARLEERLEGNELNYTKALHKLTLQVEKLSRDNNLLLNRLNIRTSESNGGGPPPGLEGLHIALDMPPDPTPNATPLSTTHIKKAKPPNKNAWVTVRR
tara:strand:- start:802 stop:1140 length:339 start_codon:yes stop_codon:yes gene_type:complete